MQEAHSPTIKHMQRRPRHRAPPIHAGPATNPNVKASIYMKKGTVLLFVSHLKRDQTSATLTLDRKKLNLPPGDLTATDALTMQTVALTGNKLHFDFDGITYKIVQVSGENVVQ